MLLEIKINLHPVNFVIISGILQCVILAAILILRRTGNRQANCFIGLFILICSLHFLWGLIIDTNLADIFKEVFWLPYSYLLAIGPLLFFYTKSLTQNNFKWALRATVHFLPVILEVLIQVFYIWRSIDRNIVHYELPGFLLFRTVELTATGASIIFYGKQSIALISVHERRIIQNFSNQKDITLEWLRKLIKYLRVLWICWLAFEVSFLLFLQFQMHLIPVYLLLYALLGTITYSNYWIGIQALIKSHIIVNPGFATASTESSNVYARLKSADIDGFVEALNQMMQNEKLYLHETLSLRTLAIRLQLDPNLVSYLLNSVLKKSFYDYVNELRIEEVKRKIEDPAYAHLKIVEVGFECGFSSKATFNRVFKKMTGRSPSEYKKEAVHDRQRN